MSKKESDDAAIALRKEKERARIAAYRAANLSALYFDEVPSIK